MGKIRTIVFLSLFSLSVIINIALSIVVCQMSREIVSLPEQKQEVTEEPDTLTEWQVFTMALMKVESGYNQDAVSSAGAKGYFQITPIYVREVNRIHGTDYTFDQVTDFNSAYEIFDMMQKARNPDYDMEKALTLHNGNNQWYHKRVYQEMDRIKKYENLRQQLKSI